MNFKEMKIRNGTYQEKSLTIPTGKINAGNFVLT